MKCATVPFAVNPMPDEKDSNHSKILLMENSQSQNLQPVDTLVIGAGLSGLCAAGDLQQAGHSVLVVDKGRGLGGRLAGRRIGEASFDHGAQFMTTRHPRFQRQLNSGFSRYCRGGTAAFPDHPATAATPAIAEFPP